MSLPRRSARKGQFARQTTMTRRRLFAASTAAFGVAAASVFIPRETLAQDRMTKQLTIYTWGGSFADAVRKAIVEPFQKETGVHVTMGVTGNPAQMFALLKAGSLGGATAIDVMWEDLTFTYSAVKQGLVEPLRLENIPSYKTVYPKFNKLHAPVPWDPGTDVHGAPAEYVPRGMANNTKIIKGDLSSVRELWNKDYVGKVGIYSDVQWMMENASFYTGQKINDIGDLGKVWKALAQQRNLVAKYFDNWADGMELMKNETLAIAPFVSGRAVQLARQGAPIRFWLPKDGWTLNADLLLVGKGSRNRYTAEKFIEFTYRPDIATRTAELEAYCVASFNMRSTPIVKQLPGYDPTGQMNGVAFADPTYWDKNLSVWTEKVRQIQSS